MWCHRVRLVAGCGLCWGKGVICRAWSLDRTFTWGLCDVGRAVVVGGAAAGRMLQLVLVSCTASSTHEDIIMMLLQLVVLLWVDIGDRPTAGWWWWDWGHRRIHHNTRSPTAAVGVAHCARSTADVPPRGVVIVVVAQGEEVRPRIQRLPNRGGGGGLVIVVVVVVIVAPN